MKPQFMQSRARAIVAVLTALTLLSACGSKPGASDIGLLLANVQSQCNRIEIRDVKKTNGMDAPGNQYQVAYSFVVEIKGGAKSALDFWAKWRAIAADGALIPEGHKAEMSAIYKRVDALMDCNSPVGQKWIDQLNERIEVNFQQDRSPVLLPYGLEFQGAMLMKKAESGWIPMQEMQGLSIIRVVQDKTLTLDPPPISAPTSNVAAPTSSPTGVLAATAQAGDVTPNVPQAPAQATAPAQAQSPSFDCAKVTTQVEKVICGDSKLAALDVAVVNAYKNALLRTADKDAATAQQTEWRRVVRDVCPSAECLADAYQRRLAQLH